MGFDDLLAENKKYAEAFNDGGFDGIAHKGVLLLTCMDSRIDPLRMVGLGVGDAKILRTPGAHLTEDALRGCILAAHLLGVTRVMLVAHTRCAMATRTDEELHLAFLKKTKTDSRGFKFGADPDQEKHLKDDLSRLAHHPLIADRVEIAGFIYDVDTGLLNRVYADLH